MHWLLSKIALMEQIESSVGIKWTDCGGYCTMYTLERHTHVLECFVLAVARIIKINRTIPSWIEDALSDKVLYNAQDRRATQERSEMYKWWTVQYCLLLLESMNHMYLSDTEAAKKISFIRMMASPAAWIIQFDLDWDREREMELRSA